MPAHPLAPEMAAETRRPRRRRRMQRQVLLLAALSLLAAGPSVGQVAEPLPPIAPRPPPPSFGPPPGLDQSPAERFRPLPPAERFQTPRAGPSAPELQQSDEQRRSAWRGAVEAEFREVWGRSGCFPHPQRHGAWFYEFADRLGAVTEDQQRLLYGLVMERGAAHEPPLTPPERVLREGQRWLDDLIGQMSRPSAPDDFCR